jgi:protease-4
MSDDGNRKKPHGCRFGCLALALTVGGLLALVALAVAYGVSSAAGGCTAGGRGLHLVARGERGEDEVPLLREVWSSGTGVTKVVRVPLTGLIFLGGDDWLGDQGASAVTALRAIRRATHDPEVEGILLEVDSGGGGITASDEIYEALLAFKRARQGRAIVTLMGDVAASGAYYVALASDTIMAHPTTLTGSIGVILQSYNIQELAAKVGIKDVTIKSGANKDLLNPFRELSAEQQAMLQGVVDALHRRFVRLVAESRALPEEEVRRLADGRIFVADDALACKLIDEIGYGPDAEEALADLLDAPALRVVRYEEDLSLLDLFRFRRGFGASLSSLLAPRDARLMYRWGL